jgi:hypothetical protein
VHQTFSGRCMYCTSSSYVISLVGDTFLASFLLFKEKDPLNEALMFSQSSKQANVCVDADSGATCALRTYMCAKHNIKIA